MSAFESSATFIAPAVVVPIMATDGARSELIFVQPNNPPGRMVYWLPAMGVPAKYYVPLAEAFAARGIAVALHEWRGIGSSDQRAGRHVDWGYRDLLEADLVAGIAEAKLRWPHAALWVGGHSLGGQLACLYAGLHRGDVSGIVLVASGAPYWRCFSHGRLILAAYVFAAALARLIGRLPGRKIGFGGNEARGVIADWARSGRIGRYSVTGMKVDVERQMSAIDTPILALRMCDDWLAPSLSLDWLLDKMPKAVRRTGVVTSEQLAGQPADHFSWMKVPEGIAAQLSAWLLEPATGQREME